MNNKAVQESLKQVGIRMIEEPPLLSTEPINKPEDAVRVLGNWLSEMDRELFCVVNLNAALMPINMNIVSMGALNETYVHPRETMKSAILSNAAYLMLVHNHPSSNVHPSKEDITTTDRIQNVASMMGIPVLDHIIVGKNQEFFSLRENNIFSFRNDIQYASDISKLQWTQQVMERSEYGGQGQETKESKLDTIMKSLEEGVEKIFTSEQYHVYLDTMSKFHNYSFNNTLLIALQRPDATLVAGYQTWQKKFQRHVKRGEKGIKIIAPVPVKEKREIEKVDEETQEIVIGEDGQPETEVVERILPRFRVTTVFDVSQTDGEPLPTIEAKELEGDVIIYEDFMKGLEELSPVPFQFIEIEGGAKGYYSKKYIAIQKGMSNAQTMKTAVHETAHAILHDRDIMEENGLTKDRMTKEVEAESVAYVVCNRFGLDTSDYSFSYIAGWSTDKEMSELRNSMDTIRYTSSQLISDMVDKLQEIQKNHEVQKGEDEKVINAGGVIVKFSAEFNSEWEVIRITNMSRDDVGKLIYDMAALDMEKWDGDYITYLEQHGAEITLVDSSMSSNGLDPEYYDFEFTVDANPSVIEGRRLTDEKDLFLQTDNYYMVYQYDHTDGDWGYKFMGLDIIKNMGLAVDGKDYRMVYRDNLNENESLDELYARFNLEQPEGFEGHSLSVSDVIVIRRNEEMKAYFVDDVGFSELPDFIRQREEIINMTLDQAAKQNDADTSLDSRKLNIDCKNAIEQAIKENYDGTHLNPNGAFAVIENFGVERVSFVLANTLHQRFKDGRFSDRNKQWGASIKIPENIRQGVDLNKDYIVNSHSAVLNGFIDLVRHEIAARRIEEILGKKRIDFAEKKEGYATEIDMNNHSDIDEAEVTITADTKEFEAEGHEGTWHTVDEREYAGEKFFLMEHDEYGSDVAGIIVSEQGQLVAEDLWNGYDAGALEAISEYLQEKGISVEGLMPEHEPDELAYKIDDNYFAIHTTEGGYDYTIYDEKYRELDGGVYDDDTLPITKVIQNLLEEEGLSIEDANIIDYEELMADVEEVQEEQMQWIQLEKNCPASIFEGFHREEALQTCEGIAMQFIRSKGYLTVQATEEGYFYIFYDSNLHEINSNNYDVPNVSVQKATYEILKSESMEDMECVKVDYKEFEAMTIQHSKDLLQAGELRATSEIGRDEAALNGLSRAEVEWDVLYHAQSILEEMGLENEVELLAARVHGSRSREELYRNDSDLDVVLSYRGNIREDSFFNELNANGMVMAGIKVDINPIAEERITLAEYIKESDAYLDQQEIKKLAVDLDNFSYDYDSYEYKDNVENREEQVEKIIENISNNDIEGFKEWLTTVSEESDIDSEIITARSLLTRLENIEKNHMVIKDTEQNTITFYVAECMEFPSLGESHENLTLDEALKIYESIPAERMSAIKGIGFDLQDGSDYEGKYGLMYLGRVDRENVEMIQHYKENPSIQKALDTLENYCKQDSLSADEKMKTDKQQDNNRKKKQTNIQRGLRI